jgi:hypothetical protein
MDELKLSDLQIQRAVKHYESLKKHQYKYNHSEGGLEKRKLATKRYYDKNKLDPEFKKKCLEKVKKSQNKKKLQLLEQSQNEICI